jgi:hypothetical protein
MYKPSNIREFVTPAVHKKATETTVNNRTRKELVEVGTARGKFKQKGTAETNANGLTVINEKTTFTTWFKKINPYEAKDILTIGGIDYEIIGVPENVEMRSRYAIITLERIGGGA